MSKNTRSMRMSLDAVWFVFGVLAVFNASYGYWYWSAVCGGMAVDALIEVAILRASAIKDGTF